MAHNVIARPDCDRVIVLENKKAGSGSAPDIVRELLSRLRSYGFQPDRFDDIDRFRLATDEAREAGRLRVVVAAGGDGTLQLVANLTKPTDPLTILPLGTENLAAKNFRFARDPQVTCDLICHGKTQRLDAGMANDRLFLVMLGCGFDAEIVRTVHENRRGHISKWAYALPILKTIRDYRFPRMKIAGQRQTSEGTQKFETTSSWAFLFNLPRYASGLRIVPQANATDGQLDLRTYRGGGLLTGISHLVTVALQCQAEWNGAFHRRIESVTIAPEEANAGVEIPFQIDGDPGGILPVTVRTLPKRITMMLPA